ncbi:hypothetical protein BKI52_06120 [marine bacterium AO1-C]|nr:hypothetical protein BKI52_06120 [marine bacterium AO1-C]
MKQTVTERMEARGWIKGAGSDFFYPDSNYPHLHARFKNASKLVDDWDALKEELEWVTLSFGGQPGKTNVKLVRGSRAGRMDFTDELRKINRDRALKMQDKVNELTGHNININESVRW